MEDQGKEPVQEVAPQTEQEPSSPKISIDGLTEVPGSPEIRTGKLRIEGLKVYITLGGSVTGDLGQARRLDRLEKGVVGR
ncbi:hypothetical protein ISS42_00120 [Candidatus Shapirobacteria bacterium]|nr:hypothetical protein [Candidatus Shapirobacteria bacterium]